MSDPASSYWSSSYLSGWFSDRSPSSRNLIAQRKENPVLNAYQDVDYEGLQTLTRCAESAYVFGRSVVSLVGLSCTMLYAHVEHDRNDPSDLHTYSIKKAQAIHSSQPFQMLSKGVGMAFGCYTVAFVAVPLVSLNLGKCLLAGLAETSMVAFEFKTKGGNSEILEASRKFWEATDVIGLDKRLHDNFRQYDPSNESFWESYNTRCVNEQFCAPAAQATLDLGKAYFSVAREMATSASEKVKAVLPENVRNRLF